jgi:hypothetical protein
MHRLFGGVPSLPPTPAPNTEVGVIWPGSGSPAGQVAWADIFGQAVTPVTRKEAMRVPAVAKARATLVTFAAGAPLRALDATGVRSTQPAWMYRTNGMLSPWHRMAWTMDDVFFYGWSCWTATLGSDRFPLYCDRVPYGAWAVDADQRIVYSDDADPRKGQPIPGAFLIPGPSEGILDNMSGTIRAAANLERSWAGRVRQPIPVTELHETVPNALTPDEGRALVQRYNANRLDPDGTTVYTPSSVELRVHGEVATDTLVEARNAIRLDVANFTNLPAAALDGSLSTASLTYSTQEGKESDVAQAVRYWTDPIAHRLSQDDIVPAGTRTRLDFGQFQSLTPPATGPIVED